MNGSWSLVHVDVTHDISPLTDPPDTANVRIILWWHEMAVGHVDLVVEQFPLSGAHLAHEASLAVAALAAARGTDGHGHLAARADGSAEVSGLGRAAARLADEVAPDGDPTMLLQGRRHPTDDLAVVICTRGRGDRLRATLEALAAQAAPPVEVVVVDNNDRPAPEIAAVAGVAGAVIVHEPRAGLARARNAGVMATTAPLIAFTDDDAVPHRRWTAELGQAFADVRAEVVTGLILPADLDSRSAVIFEIDKAMFSAGYLPIRYGTDFYERARGAGVPVWNIGAGANMAIRRTALERVGGFDHRLGAGASGCAEDSELWYRVLATGGECVYEPAAIVTHTHRGTRKELRRQLGAYMEGHAAALVAQADRHGDRGNIRRLTRTLPRYYAGRVARSVRRGHLHATRDDMAEVAGLARGASYLLRPRWRRDDDLGSP